jgi:hypothetical protein
MLESELMANDETFEIFFYANVDSESSIEISNEWITFGKKVESIWPKVIIMFVCGKITFLCVCVFVNC